MFFLCKESLMLRHPPISLFQKSTNNFSKQNEHAAQVISTNKRKIRIAKNVHRWFFPSNRPCFSGSCRACHGLDGKNSAANRISDCHTGTKALIPRKNSENSPKKLMLKESIWKSPEKWQKTFLFCLGNLVSAMFASGSLQNWLHALQGHTQAKPTRKNIPDQIS